MYVTAMWVRRGDDMGINVFVHRHDTDELVDWLEENGERWWTLPEDFPGEADRGASSFALKPGGNSVQAYMDVILRDRDWTLDAVRKALDALEVRADEIFEARRHDVTRCVFPEDEPCYRMEFKITVRLYNDLETRHHIFKMLREALDERLRVLENRAPQSSEQAAL